MFLDVHCESKKPGLILFIASQLDTAVHSVLAHCHQLHLAWKSLTSQNLNAALGPLENKGCCF